MKGEMVVEITEVSVETPLAERAHAWVHRRGVFSKFTGALEWMSHWVAEHGPGELGGLLYYRFDERLVERTKAGLRAARP